MANYQTIFFLIDHTMNVGDTFYPPSTLVMLEEFSESQGIYNFMHAQPHRVASICENHTTEITVWTTTYRQLTFFLGRKHFIFHRLLTRGTLEFLNLLSC